MQAPTTDRGVATSSVSGAIIPMIIRRKVLIGGISVVPRLQSL